MGKQKVLFLCTGNSARSQMAEALLRHKASDRFDVFSAGTRPESVDERSIEALNKFNINSSGLVSKSIKDLSGEHFDYVITLCDKANEECRNYPNTVKQLAWDFPDPKTRSGSNAFSQTLNELNNRLSMFLLVESKATDDSKIKEQVLNEQYIDLLPTSFFKSLTDETRLKTLMLMQYQGELCVCELMHALNESNQPKISRNLAVLKRSEIILDRKHKQWVFYRINPALPLWAKSSLAYTTENNVAQISHELERLDTMKGRPDRDSQCQ